MCVCVCVCAVELDRSLVVSPRTLSRAFRLASTLFGLRRGLEEKLVVEIKSRFPSLASMMVRRLCRDAELGRDLDTTELATRLKFLHTMTQHTDMVGSGSRGDVFRAGLEFRGEG